MSSKRKSNPTKKPKAKSRKVEYDDEDISSEHESDVEDEQRNLVGPSADGEADAEDDLADLASIPELPAPEVSIQRFTSLFSCLVFLFYYYYFFLFR